MVTLLASGSNARGQLGSGTLDDSHTFTSCQFSGFSYGVMPIGTTQILSIAGGANHTLALLERLDEAKYTRTELWGCGDGARGQLGSSYLKESKSADSTAIFRLIDFALDVYSLNGYTFKSIASSWETTYVGLASFGKGDILISLGADDYGNLGVGGLETRNQPLGTPQSVKFDHIKVDGLSIDTSRLIITSLMAGPHHVIVVLDVILTDESRRCITVGWGISRHGQLGDVRENSGRAVPFLNIPTVVHIAANDEEIVTSSLGNQHTIFLHSSGHLTGFGSNKKGQLCGIDSLENVQYIGCTWNGTYAIVKSDEQSRILATGSHSMGQLGRTNLTANRLGGIDDHLAPIDFPFPLASRQLRTIACGSEHLLAIFSHNETSKEEVWGWGWNEHGNLGVGTVDNIPLPVKIWPLDSESAGEQRPVGIWGGCGTSWIAIR